MINLNERNPKHLEKFGDEHENTPKQGLGFS